MPTLPNELPCAAIAPAALDHDASSRGRAFLPNSAPSEKTSAKPGNARARGVPRWFRRTPQEEGVIYYLDDGRVRGVLLWNVWDKVDEARALIEEANQRDEDPPGPESLRGRL